MLDLFAHWAKSQDIQCDIEALRLEDVVLVLNWLRKNALHHLPLSTSRIVFVK